MTSLAMWPPKQVSLLIKMTEAKHRKLPSDNEDDSEDEFCLDFYTIHRKNNEVSISIDDDSNDSLKDNYINEADLRDDPSVNISNDKGQAIISPIKTRKNAKSTRNLRTNSHQKQAQRPKNADQTSKNTSSCNDGVDTMDTTSSDSLKNRLRSRNKKQIIVDTLDLTDEVSLPVKPSPVIIDNLSQPYSEPGTRFGGVTRIAGSTCYALKCF
ncbi:unnamed protein product [Timema podura]|uniref:Uncharacterized protein n=1 Tax=Timema podura TaxID=61482 RepID=A0ABN7NR54_TIMPD|nr:unnamed protein product [Timema podura]